MHSGLTRIALTLTCAFAAVGAEASDHWAFQPVTRPSVPAVSGAAWPSGALDHFVLAKLRENGMQPARRAGRRTLIRRVTLDLTGLPPTPGEVDAFVAADSPGAYRRRVERVLASPRFGERWGRHWLDVARYADTKGYLAGNQARHRCAPGGVGKRREREVQALRFFLSITD